MSVATVSHVLNGTRPVREQTRKRVESAITEVDYRPDRLARAMRKTATDSVGLVVSDPAQPVFAEMIRGVSHEARELGYMLLLSNSSDDDPARELESVQALVERRIDGLLLAEMSHSPTEVMDILARAHTPLVLLDRLSGWRVDQVGSESAGPMRVLVEHLLDKGHRHILLVAGDLSVPTLQERFEGYRAALELAGLTLDRSLIVSNIRTVGEARAALRPILLDSRRPTAIVSASTNMTAGTLAAMKDLGLRAPDDVAFVSFDEMPFAELFQPRITSVVQPAFAIGKRAMRMLYQRIQQPDREYSTIRLDPRIEHRESCGCPEDAPPL